MATEEQEDRIAEAVKALPLRLRQVFVMATAQRKSFTDIARALGISQMRVEGRFRRALKRCRGKLEI